MKTAFLDRLLKYSFRNIHDGTHGGKFRHYSYLIHKNKIISIGFNKPITHPLADEYGLEYAGLHSELNAIIKLPYNATQYKKLISKCDIVNIRLTKTGNICISKPCEICQQILEQYKVNNVYYTITCGNMKRVTAKDAFITYRL